MSEPVITARALTQRFGTVTALDHVDLTVARGQIYGFLGRNGAGKTTLIRILLGLLSPTGGEVSVLGTPVRGGRTPAPLWARIGYLVEGPGLYPGLTVTEHLRIAAGYRRLAPSAITAVTERLDLARYADVRAGVLSLGNRQRLGLALALVHRPPLLILDEPVNGLDPAGVVDVRHLLRELADGGTTVFMSTHLIGEVTRLADRVGIIHAGSLVEELAGERLGAGSERLVAAFRTADLARRAVEALRARGINAETRTETRAGPRTDAPAGTRSDPGAGADTGAGTRPDTTLLTSTAEAAIRRPDDVVTLLVRAGAAPISLRVESEDLEELFLRLTTGVSPEERAA
jgi:ABC-2 type transport system ATP-binding protein